MNTYMTEDQPHRRPEGKGSGRPLHILFLTNRLPYPIKDGQSRRTYHVLKGLCEEHDVHLLSLGSRSLPEQAAAIAHLKQFCARIDVIEAPPKRVSLPMLLRLARSLVSREPYTIWRHYSDKFLNACQAILAAGQVNIVHCDILPIAYAIRGVNGVPCSLTDHDVCYIKSGRIAQQASNPLLKAMYMLESWKLKRFEKRMFSEVSVGLAVSDVDRRILQTLTRREDLEVVPNGVDTDEFAPAPMEAMALRLLWVGGFDYSPNRDGVQWFLHEIYPSIRAQVPGIQCDLVGGGDSSDLRAFAREDQSVVFHGFVKDPVPFLHAAEVFVVPLRSGSGTRLKLLEAMAAGKAVVTTSVGAEGIEGRDGEHFLIADDPKLFAKRTVDLLREPEERRRIGVSARDLVIRKYDWKIVCRKLNAVYRRLTWGDESQDL